MKKTALITGGAGYIGSHTAYLMARNGYDVIVLDNLVHGQTFKHSWATLKKHDFADVAVLDDIFKTHRIDVVMHFAAFIEVGESVKRPKDFYENNVIKTLTLLDAMIRHRVKRFVFSSSCAVYGNPEYLPLTEEHPKKPVSPYGNNKLIIELALQDYARAYDLHYMSLRYFNASGAFPEAGLGEFHKHETHVIPLMLRAIHANQPFNLFGDDYETKDGSCVRDYVHVTDIANAHMLAAQHLEKTGISEYVNLGTGYGYSVKELIKAVERLCNKKMIVNTVKRRPGDPATLVADPSKAMRILAWKPYYSDLDFIIKSALKWEMDNRFFISAGTSLPIHQMR